jgi:hypothetical protein
MNKLSFTPATSGITYGFDDLHECNDMLINAIAIAQVIDDKLLQLTLIPIFAPSLIDPPTIRGSSYKGDLSALFAQCQEVR